MYFEIVGSVSNIETIAAGSGIREVGRLKGFTVEGYTRWRKLKGFAGVILEDGTLHQAEIHRYEALVFGRRDIKIKRLLD